MADQEPNTLLLLGEIRGQLREIVHTNNNNGSKIDAVVIRIGTLEQIIPTVSAMEVRLGKVEAQMGTLNTDKDRRAGAMSLGEWIVKIVPWAVGGGIFAVVARFIGVAT